MTDPKPVGLIIYCDRATCKLRWKRADGEFLPRGTHLLYVEWHQDHGVPFPEAKNFSSELSTFIMKARNELASQLAAEKKQAEELRKKEEDAEKRRKMEAIYGSMAAKTEPTPAEDVMLPAALSSVN